MTKYSVITASHNQLAWLKRCVRSVADQSPGVEIEHIIQDKASGPELQRWLQANSSARLVVEEDQGFYDALNRGLRRATGEIVAILNCDEQYLPEALVRVEQTFRENPDADIVAGDYLITTASGELLCFRRATPLRPSMILTDHLYDFTCALFFRRRLVERGIFFDPAYQAAGDADWVSRLLFSGARVAYLRGYLAAFAITGDNLSLRANPAAEIARLKQITPRWALAAAPLLRQVRHLEKLFLGGYHSPSITYEIFKSEDDTQRTKYICEEPSFRHPWG